MFMPMGVVNQGAAVALAIPVLESYQSVDSGATLVTSKSFTAPAGISAGDLLVIASASDNTATCTHSIVAGTYPGWTKLGQKGASVSDVQVCYHYKIASGSEGAVTVNITATRRMMGTYFRFSGANATTPIHVSNSYESPSAGHLVHPISSVTTTNDLCYILGYMAFDQYGGLTWSSWTPGEYISSTSFFACTWGHTTKDPAGTVSGETVTSILTNGSVNYVLAIQP